MKKKQGLYQVLAEDPPAMRLAEPEATYLVRQVRQGVAMEEFFALQELLGLSEEALADALGMSRTTLHRRKKSGTLDSVESERVLRVTRMFVRAEEVFESRQAAREWLRAPAVALQGESPLEYLDTEIGAREVENILGRLEHGVFF
jgi:putative toxin-antitoxin system antitoxin component (TIGR02293 family)